jgi:hypothetical protein
MKRTALAAYVSGYYLATLGCILFLAPNQLLPLFGFPASTEAWIRVVGVLTASFGWYSIAAARNVNVAYFRASLIQRPGLFVCFVGLVLADHAPPALILFGGVELLGAAWMLWAMIADGYLHRRESNNDA